MRNVRPIHPSHDVMPLGRLGHHEIDVLRLLLKGASVVDWFRLHLADADEIDAYLRVNELEPNDPEDRARLAALRKKAVVYLVEHLGYKVPEVIADGDFRSLVLYAAGKGRRAYRMYACMALKVMHIIHYTEAHELLSMLPISDAELAILLTAKVERVVRGLLERNFPLVEFTGNTKTDYSILSKLLAKKSTQATALFDKVRFRFVVARREDIPPLLVAITRELVPFNYLVPNQAENTLVDIESMLVRAGNLPAIRARKNEDSDLNESGDDVQGESKNEFSGPDYRIVNFVAEVPIRADRILSFEGNPRLEDLGRVVFGTVEFQVVDHVTAKSNEIGENKHSLYKRRQLLKVQERLERGKRKKVPRKTAAEG
jgi:uncharacterized protein (TIGR04552 family)